MKQALHIFKKDVSYLRYEIGITLLAVVAFILGGIRHVPVFGAFLPVTWWFLIARLIHAEALPGDRQFWLTRPYEWKSLLGAKVLFILVFINLPLLTADAVIVHAVGFSLGQEVAGLLWTQLLLIMAFVLPVAAFSAITSGLGELLFATLLVVIGILARLVTPWIHWGSPWFELEWIRTYCFVAQLAAAAAVILLWQYARRNTFGTRIAAGGAAVVVLASSSLLPWTTAFALETHLSRRNIAASSIRIELDSDRKWLGRIYDGEHDQTVAELPLRLSGFPPGAKLRPNGLTVTLSAPDGETWTVKQPPPYSFSFEAGIISMRAVMGAAFYNKVKDEPLELRGTLFFTLYGNQQSARIPLNSGSVPVSGILCSAGAHFLRCDSVFRAPSDLVAIRVFQEFPTGPKATTESPFRSTSYSPFPADLTVDPLYQSFFAPYIDTISEARVETLQPLAHLEQDFAIDHVRLTDFAASSPSGAIK